MLREFSQAKAQEPGKNECKCDMLMHSGFKLLPHCETSGEKDPLVVFYAARATFIT